MEEKYKPILPEDVFVTALDREPSEEELWLGATATSMGNRPSGNSFVDLFAYLIRKYGRRDTAFYAKIMGTTPLDLNAAFRAMSGITAFEWRNRYLQLEAEQLLEKTDIQITDISKKLGFSQPSIFSKSFIERTGQQPWEWRVNKQKRDCRWKKTYHFRE